MKHDDESWEDVVDCPSCGTVQFDDEALIELLGSTAHYRCRACGWQWAREVELVEVNE